MSEIMEGQVWHCPKCHGHGTLSDACVVFGPQGRTSIQTASVCYLCRGKGLVLVQPLPEGYPSEGARGESER
jgi:DnaJ-class molecular chaperone